MILIFAKSLEDNQTSLSLVSVSLKIFANDLGESLIQTIVVLSKTYKSVSIKNLCIILKKTFTITFNSMNITKIFNLTSGGMTRGKKP
jgi:hypothetical protein